MISWERARHPIVSLPNLKVGNDAWTTCSLGRCDGLRCADDLIAPGSSLLSLDGGPGESRRDRLLLLLLLPRVGHVPARPRLPSGLRR